MGPSACPECPPVCPGDTAPQWSAASLSVNSAFFSGAGLARMSDNVMTVLPIPISSQMKPPRTSAGGFREYLPSNGLGEGAGGGRRDKKGT
jgi:hypothetical protein